MKTKNRVGQVIGELGRTGFEEVAEQTFAKSEIDMTDYALEARLLNWGRVVGSRGRAGGNCSSAWAADYIANRNNRDLQLALRLKMVEPASLLKEIERQAASEADHRDGWFIESAWRLLGSLEHKQALRFKYVFGWGDGLIRRKLRLRGRENVSLILWRGKTSLQQVLARTEKTATIQSHNLTAGNPCLKSVAQAGLATSEAEALMD